MNRIVEFASADGGLFIKKMFADHINMLAGCKE